MKEKNKHKFPKVSRYVCSHINTEYNLLFIMIGRVIFCGPNVQEQLNRNHLMLQQ